MTRLFSIKQTGRRRGNIANSISDWQICPNMDQSFPIIIQLLTDFFFFFLSLHLLSDGEDDMTGSLLVQTVKELWKI